MSTNALPTMEVANRSVSTLEGPSGVTVLVALCFKVMARPVVMLMSARQVHTTANKCAGMTRAASLVTAAQDSL